VVREMSRHALQPVLFLHAALFLNRAAAHDICPAKFLRLIVPPAPVARQNFE
jgi:hypothetical protein